MPFGTEAGDTLALFDDDIVTSEITLSIPFPFYGAGYENIHVSNSTNKKLHSPSHIVNYSEHYTKQLHFCSVS